MIVNAEFLTSVAALSQLPDVPIEIAISGKSNVGKSSFINAMTRNGKLAKTSKDPGRTRLINYFGCNNGKFTLVDLPGYGYAKVAKVEKERWAQLIEGYFGAGRIKHLVQLLDIRHDPTQEDVMMINYLYHYSIPFTLVATKADKLSKAEQGRRRQSIATFLRVGVDNIFMFSSVTKQGKEAIDERISGIVEYFSTAHEEDLDEENDGNQDNFN